MGDVVAGGAGDGLAVGAVVGVGADDGEDAGPNVVVAKGAPAVEVGVTSPSVLHAAVATASPMVMATTGPTGRSGRSQVFITLPVLRARPSGTIGTW